MNIDVTLELLKRYDRPGPRYTSYPTAVEFNESYTEAEYREVQRHPTLGAEKLGDHHQLQDVCRYVVEHHEKWNGAGYPRGIAGEQISLPGRILGVVEVFDSLSTRRSYKDVWELERTIEFFRGQRGEAFDPEVIDEFLPLLEEHGEEWIAAPQKDLEAAGVPLGD